MKKVRCPKCNSYTIFDETRYEPGQRLVFVCTQCGKQFAIKTPSNTPSKGEKADNLSAKEALPLREGLGGSVGSVGSIIVVENAFHFRQEIQEFRSAKYGALALPEAVKMVLLQEGYHVVHYFFEGFYVPSGFHVAFPEGQVRVIQDRGK